LLGIILLPQYDHDRPFAVDYFLSMSHSRKKQLHYCSVHTKTKAAGRCSICKAWVCSFCAQKTENRTVCPLCKQAFDPGTKQLQNEQQPVQHRMLQLMLLAAITLCLCSVLFGLWQMRLRMNAEAQLAGMHEKRTELVNQIRARNQEITDLRTQVDVPEPKKVGKKQDVKVSTGPTTGSFLSINGLPVSFDNGTTSKKLVCLTFDGSSFCNATQNILDTLASRQVKATMFLSGQFIKKYAPLVHRIVRDGHEIGNHTYSHPRLTSYAQNSMQQLLPQITQAFIARELQKNDSIFAILTGRKMSPLWRSPYGEHNKVLCIWAQHAGYLHVGWREGQTWKQSLDSNDGVPYEETAGFHSPEEVYRKIMTLAEASPNGINGGIILMHLGNIRTKKDMQVYTCLGKLIDSLQNMGYRFVVVSEMMKESGVDIGLLGNNSN
jgi:peptidoglycan/xylan/chitin deacetylase (PgdA/CDA1 family)